jgi:flagellar biosynthesis protein FlhF
MQVRKFEAPTMQEALVIVKQELGPDAIILSTKNNRKGFGLLSKASVEVTAAISEKDLSKKKITERFVPSDTKERIRNLPASKQAKIYNEFSQHYKERAADKNKTKNISRYIDIKDDANDFNPAELLNNKSNPARQSEQSAIGYNARSAVQSKIDQAVNEYETRLGSSELPQSDPIVNATNSEDINSLKNDIRRLKDIVEELKYDQVSLQDIKSLENNSSEIREEFNSLLRNGVDRKYAASLVKQAVFSIPKDHIENTEKVLDAIALELMQNIRVENILPIRPGGEQRVYAFFGPTGVGKTTTIAKIASDAMLTKNLKVGLINIDAYRVGASDQLATYAKILSAPFRNATNEQELERALNEFKPMDIILIDTTGRSQKDQESLTEMKKMVDGFSKIKSILVLSSTTRDQELYDIINRFKIFKPQSLVFSKLDESTVYGCIYNVTLKTGLPIAYFTMGQRVPEDIEVASPERVADLIMDI